MGLEDGKIPAYKQSPEGLIGHRARLTAALNAGNGETCIVRVLDAGAIRMPLSEVESELEDCRRRLKEFGYEIAVFAENIHATEAPADLQDPSFQVFSPVSADTGRQDG